MAKFSMKQGGKEVGSADIAACTADSVIYSVIYKLLLILLL